MIASGSDPFFSRSTETSKFTFPREIFFRMTSLISFSRRVSERGKRVVTSRNRLLTLRSSIATEMPFLATSPRP